ncbi:probable serine/threonine-protein kinase dyrk1 [Microplitis mediator]|uniref:probable serine/threonine-protein kinase dyrk1 n=1 Tax=Microplitis mediator TaxID=375433 RepID=UPI0025568A3C|nr:probable serine/threonine-protein kinase dyrk1 [Microplitis mediator]
MAFREGWLITDLIKILGYLFVGKVTKWYDTYSRHWTDYGHFKREFLRAFGSHKTDTQLLMEIGQLRPEAGESSTDFVFRVQQKYGEMRNPPPESEQVTCIRNHLPRSLSTLVFSRLVNNYDDLLSVLHEAAVLLEENKRTFESSEKSNSKTKEKSRFSAVHTSPRNSILVDMMNGKQPLIIEEIREGEDGQFIVCASAATVQPPQQNFSSYRPQNNRARNSNNASNNGSFNVTPRSYSEATAGRNLDQDFCHNCGQNGHTFEQCNNIRVDVCNFCLRAGHIKQNCFQANGGPPNNGSNPNFIPGNFRVNDNRNDSGNQFHDNNRAISNSQGENNVNNNRNNNHSNCVEVQSTSAGDASYPQSSKN